MDRDREKYLELALYIADHIHFGNIFGHPCSQDPLDIRENYLSSEQVLWYKDTSLPCLKRNN